MERGIKRGRGRKLTIQSVNSKRRTKQWENILELTASGERPTVH